MYYLFLATIWVIVFPSFIAFIRFSQIPKEFKPLVYLLWLGLATEVAALISAKLVHNNLYIYNTYMLADFFMTLWLFYGWGAFRRIRKPLLYGIASLFLCLWVFDNCLLNSITQSSIIFRMTYSITLVLLGIEQLSRIYVNNNGYLNRNPYLYICLGVIFYYTYNSFIPLLTDSSLFSPSPTLWRYTMLIYSLINVVTNILYSIALLWMRKKARYT